MEKPETRQWTWTSVKACGCVTAGHEHSWCPQNVAQEQRGRLFAGQYEGWRETRRWLGSVMSRFRLLDPDYAGSDPAGLRFAHLELD